MKPRSMPISFIRKQWRPTIRAIAATVLALLTAQSALGLSTPFSQVIVFGDSLSDTGNLYRLSGGVLPPPASYPDHRFCNGPVWVEYLTRDLGMQLLPENVYAVGGATTGRENENDANPAPGMEYPGLQDQIAQFLSTHASGADPHALYIVWAGANDFFMTLSRGGSPLQLISQGVANTAGAVQQLYAAGARHILVVNIPDLGLTPAGRASGMGPAISQLSAAYNQVLKTALQSLAEAGLPTIQVDAFATLQSMVNFPAEFGFANVTVPWLMVGSDPDEFLFLDPKHATTRGHQVLGEAALDALIKYYSPRQGRGTPDALVNSLNGLVTASPGN